MLRLVPILLSILNNHLGGGEAGNKDWLGQQFWLTSNTTKKYVKLYLGAYSDGNTPQTTNLNFNFKTSGFSTLSIDGALINDTPAITPLGWSLFNTSTNIYCSLEPVFSTDYCLYVLAEQNFGQLISFVELSNSNLTEIQHVVVQAVVFADAAPGNCLGEDVLVETPHGMKPIREIKSKEEVFALDESGVRHRVVVDVLQFAPGMILTGKQIGDVFISENDLIFFPFPQESKPCCQLGCDRCAPFKIKGYHQYVAKDLIHAEDVSRHNQSWYHLTPVLESDYHKAMCLSNGLLSEFNRTPVPTMREQGHVFTLL